MKVTSSHFCDNMSTSDQSQLTHPLSSPPCVYCTVFCTVQLSAHVHPSFFRRTSNVSVSYGPRLWSRSRRLGLETVSRRNNVSSRKKMSTFRSRLGLGRKTSRSRLGLGHLRLVPNANFRPNCAGHSMQCERALDVVSLCCSYYCSSY